MLHDVKSLGHIPAIYVPACYPLAAQLETCNRLTASNWAGVTACLSLLEDPVGVKVLWPYISCCYMADLPEPLNCSWMRR